MINFANFEFIFAIKGPKIARRGVQGKFIKYNIGGFSFYLHPWNDLEWPSEGFSSPLILLACWMYYNFWTSLSEKSKALTLSLIPI